MGPLKISCKATYYSRKKIIRSLTAEEQEIAGKGMTGGWE
jgi:hypothetical protein